jgi:hypothetical protein
MFDENTVQYLDYYVYLLLDPRDNMPFYVGKGTGNRVFAHLNGALKETDKESLKYDVIRSINDENRELQYVIVRHVLDEKTAYEVEAALIDALEYTKYNKTNIMGGHHSEERGLMTAEEITRLYNAVPLTSIPIDVVVININRKYKRGSSREDIYEAIKEAWVIARWRREKIRYILAEYRGLIVEVFELDKWYPVDNKVGFTVKRTIPDVREQYINKSVAALKNGRQWSLTYSKELSYPTRSSK